MSAFNQMAVQDRLEREREAREEELLAERVLFANNTDANLPPSTEKPTDEKPEVTKKQAPIEDLPLFAESMVTPKKEAPAMQVPSEVHSSMKSSEEPEEVTSATVPIPVPKVNLFKQSDQEIPPYKAKIIVELATRSFIEPLPQEALTRTVRELGRLPEQQLLLLAHPMAPASEMRKVTRAW